MKFKLEDPFDCGKKVIITEEKTENHSFENIYMDDKGNIATPCKVISREEALKLFPIEELRMQELITIKSNNVLKLDDEPSTISSDKEYLRNYFKWYPLTYSLDKFLNYCDSSAMTLNEIIEMVKERKEYRDNENAKANR
jgi:hypothetical protein